MTLLYQVGRALCGFVYHLGGVRMIGRENIPEDRALIIICNHVSYGDPPAVALVYPRPITFIAKEEFSRNSFTRRLFGACGAVFLKRGESDLGAMRVTINQLKQERAVAIFPEGRRNFDQRLSPFLPGASYISLRSQARVLPMAVINTGDFWRVWRRNILILVGQPIAPPPPGRPDKELLEEYTQRYQEAVTALFDQGLAQLKAEGKKMRLSPRIRRAQVEAKAAALKGTDAKKAADDE